MASFFPKALIYKEWRQQRLWGLLLFIVMSGPMMFLCFINLMQIWSEQNFQIRAGFVENMRGNLLQILGQTSYSNTLITYFFLVVAVFGSTIVAYERSHGGLWYTLSGPFTRRQVLRVKTVMGTLLLVASILAFTLMLYLFNVAAHTEIQAYLFLRWFVYELFLQSALFICSFIGATLVGHIIVAPIAGIGIAGIPGALSIYVQVLRNTTLNDSSGASISESPFYSLSHGFAASSPLYYINYNQSIDFGLFIPVMIVWIAVGYLLAQRFFQVAAIEQMTNFFTFRVLWKWFFWGVSLIVGLVVAVASSKDWYHEGTVMFVFKHAIFTVLTWLVFNLLIKLYRKKFLEV